MKFEIVVRTLNPFKNAVWKWRLKTSIVLKWPYGWIVMYKPIERKDVRVGSSASTDWYRNWLEENAGKQGWDWDWRVKEIDMTASHERILNIVDMLEIKFKDDKVATMFALKYN